MGNLEKKFETVEDFFWASKELYEPLYLIGHGLLDVFRYPDSVYIKDLRVIENGSKVEIFMVVHNASDYNFEDEVIESYFFNYNKDTVQDFIEYQLKADSRLVNCDHWMIEEMVDNSHLMRTYKEKFRESRHFIGGNRR